MGKKKKVYKSSTDGRFVTKDEVKNNPAGTVTQRVNVPERASKSDELPATNTEIISDIEPTPTPQNEEPATPDAPHFPDAPAAPESPDSVDTGTSE